MFNFSIFQFLHHGEPGDPILFAWLQHKVDSILEIGPLAAVFLFGGIIVLIPIVIFLVFWRKNSY